MSPDRWLRVRGLIDEALQRDTAERWDFLEQASDDEDMLRDARSLLVAIGEAEDFIEQPVLAQRGDVPTLLELGDGHPPHGVREEEPLSTRLGAYEVVGLLGEGGMGSVYLARRDDDVFHKQVAIKVLKLGMDTAEIVRRFRSERQILANLPHPNIAQIFDGGSTDDGRPFLVMEYVEGEPIDRYCRRRGLGVRERVELFREVCGAVHFAHQNLVVHRDLKPANVLVSEDGVPKLLDFGIAKLTSTEGFPRTVAQTAAGMAFMTPEYASPEQVLGRPVTTVGDVYSLGVMLFELLTGRRPHGGERGPGALLRAMSDAEPVRPSSVVGKTPDQRPEELGAPDLRRLRRLLRGDLDNIVLKALQRDPGRRYGSAEQLADDLSRYLDGRPVRARPDTLGYRVSKLLRRHRAAAAISLLLVLLAVGFTVALFFEQRRTLDQRDRAELASEILTEVFALPDPVRSRGESITAREILDRGTEHIEAKIAERPELRSDLGFTLGRTYKNLGLYPEAGEHLEDAVASLRREGRREERLADTLDQLAKVRGLEGQLEVAEELAGEALALRRQVHGKVHPAVVASLVHTAQLRGLGGDYQRSRLGYEEALALARRTGDVETEALVLDRFGQLLIRTGDLAEAEDRLEEALELYRSLGEDHPEVPTAMNNLALAIWTRDGARSEDLLRSALAIQQVRYREGRPSLADSLENLAHLVHLRGRYDEAEPLYGQALAMQEEIYGERHPKIASTLNKLALMRATVGDLEGAEPLYRRALEMQRVSLGEDHAETANTLSNLGQVLVRLGRLDEAEDMFATSLEVTRRALGEGHERVGIVTTSLAAVARARGETAEAERRFAAAISILRAAGSAQLSGALHNQATLLHREGRFEEARDRFAEAEAAAAEHLGPSHPETAMIATSLALVETRLGRHGEAEKLARRALSAFEETLPAESAWPAAARRALGLGLLGQERFDEAEPLLMEDFERAQRQHGPEDEGTQRALDRLIDLNRSWGRDSEVARLLTLKTESHDPRP